MADEETGRPQSIPDDAGQAEPSRRDCRGRSRGVWWKAAVVAAVVMAAVAVLAARSGKRRTDPASPLEPARPEAPGKAAPAGDAAPSGLAEPGTVLATVNGVDITMADLTEALSELPSSARHALHLVLEGLIKRELLVQKARSLGLAPAGTSDRAAVEALLDREVFAHVSVTEADLRGFYEQSKEQMPDGATYEAVRDRLRLSLLERRQRDAVALYLDGLARAATISRDQGWVERQTALAAYNPLDRALQSGRPVVADFGRGTCIPCQMMKPILDELAKEYAGGAEVLIISVDEYPALTERCRIRAIPTQIFYDASGRESRRHEGFMPREDVVAGLAQMGVK